MSEVQIARLSKRLGHVDALKGVDMTVKEGTVACLIGPSGAGKSTLLKCINGLIEPDRGHILVDGMLIGRRLDAAGRLHQLARKDLCLQRRGIGMVFQSFNLFPHLSVMQNLLLAPRLAGEKQPILVERAEELLTKVGLAEKARAYPAHLSGGQQQRVAIARALMMRPKLMLFDEPTSALDPEFAHEVLGTMRMLADEGMTMIVVTHEIKFAQDVATEVVFMADGVIVEQASTSEFFHQPRSERGRAFLSHL